jgi:hypothetical protein
MHFFNAVASFAAIAAFITPGTITESSPGSLTIRQVKHWQT